MVPPTSTEAELHVVCQTLLSADCKATYISTLRLHIARALCESLHLAVVPTGRLGPIRRDYICALRAHVCVSHVNMYTFLIFDIQRCIVLAKEEYETLETAKRKASTSDNDARRTKCHRPEVTMVVERRGLSER